MSSLRKISVSITQATSDPNEGWTFDIDWGDGGDHDFGTAAIDAAGGSGGVAAGHFAGDHVFSTDGSYTVTVKAQNNEDSLPPRLSRSPSPS